MPNEMSLVEKAMTYVLKNKGGSVMTEEEFELLVGFLSGEIALKQVQHALDTKVAGVALTWVARKTQRAFQEGRLKAESVE